MDLLTDTFGLLPADCGENASMSSKSDVLAAHTNVAKGRRKRSLTPERRQNGLCKRDLRGHHVTNVLLGDRD